jgi:RNA recognition motif-containing protein
MIIYDKFSGKPRGFGFVTFTEIESIEKVMRDKNAHFIRGKWIDCKVATPCMKKGDSTDHDASHATLRRSLPGIMP